MGGWQPAVIVMILGRDPSKVAEPGGRFGCVRYLRHKQPSDSEDQSGADDFSQVDFRFLVLGIFAICFDLKPFSLLC